MSTGTSVLVPRYTSARGVATSGLRGVTLAGLPHPEHFHLPRPLTSALGFLLSGLMVVVVMPALGLRAGRLQHAEIYSLT